MTHAGLLMREICECLGVEVQPCDLEVVLVERDEQRWHIGVATGGQRLAVYSELTELELAGGSDEYYLGMNANLGLMQGAWVGVDSDSIPRLYYQESITNLTALNVVGLLQRLVGLHRHLAAGRT